MRAQAVAFPSLVSGVWLGLSTVVLATLVAGPVTITMPFAFGYGAHGDLAARWWNEVLAGCAIAVTGLAGLLFCRAARDTADLARS